MKWLRLLVVLLAVVPLCGPIVSQEGPPITIILNEEYTGDKSQRRGYTMGGLTVPSGENRILLVFYSFLDNNLTDYVSLEANWDHAGTPEPLTLTTAQSKTRVAGDYVIHQLGYLVNPTAKTGQLRYTGTSFISNFAMTAIVLDNVDQDDPFDFGDLNETWPENTAFRTWFSLTATANAFILDFVSKFNLPGGSGLHELGTPGATQTLADNQEIGDGGSPSGSLGWRSVSWKTGLPAEIISMYRENTNTGPGGVLAIYEMREASRCVVGSTACTP